VETSQGKNQTHYSGTQVADSFQLKGKEASHSRALPLLLLAVRSHNPKRRLLTAASLTTPLTTLTTLLCISLPASADPRFFDPTLLSFAPAALRISHF
jgi:hypothetical protein